MLGAIIGDIVGSPYEVTNVYRRRDVYPFKDRLIPEIGKCRFTDDSVLTLAVARALVEHKDKTGEELELEIAKSLKEYTKRYPLKRMKIPGMSQRSLYGSGYEKWAKEEVFRKREVFIDSDGKPVSTNGAAMRVASVGWLYSSKEQVLEVAKSTAIYTHGSRDAIKAAQAIALSVFLARTTKEKSAIRKGLLETLNYSIDTDRERVKTIKAENKHYREKNLASGKYVNCDAKTTAQYAIYAFLISNSFSDCIKTAISLGGDSDTIACMAGAIAEAYYGIPAWWEQEAFRVLENEGCWAEDIQFIRAFKRKYCSNAPTTEKVLCQLDAPSKETCISDEMDKKVRLVVELRKPEYQDLLDIVQKFKSLDGVKKPILYLLGLIYNHAKFLPLQMQSLRDMICEPINKELEKITIMQISAFSIKEFSESDSKEKLLQVSVDVVGWSYAETRKILVEQLSIDKNEAVRSIGLPALDIVFEALTENALEEQVIMRIIGECKPAICDMANKALEEQFGDKIRIKDVEWMFI